MGTYHTAFSSWWLRFAGPFAIILVLAVYNVCTQRSEEQRRCSSSRVEAGQHEQRRLAYFWFCKGKAWGMLYVRRKNIHVFLLI